MSERLMSTLPLYYRESPQMRAIMQADANEVHRKSSEAEDLLAQLHIGSATWSIENYEQILGILPQPNKPIAERREVVRARMRGTANTTISQLKAVAESFYGGKVEVRTDYPNYTIYIKFVSTDGIPPNLADVEKAIRDIVPAHIAFEFEFSYLLVREVQQKTLNQLQTHTLGEFAF